MDYAEANVLLIFETHRLGDDRPRRALMAARDWFEGKVKLKEVKNTILNECHAIAVNNESNPANIKWNS